MYAIFLHAHQKIDKVAYRHLKAVGKESWFFPKFKNILYFEGNRGPDSTRLKKRQKVDQPWHFYDPFDDDDTDIHDLITGHFDGLVEALKQRDEIRSGFEAAWLAHTLVDGLTPAHHFPYEKELELLRGESRETRNGLLGRIYVKGIGPRESIRRSLQLIGPGGLLTNHALFEGGAYTIMIPLKLNRAKPSESDLRAIQKHGIVVMFERFAREIAVLDMYSSYLKKGWTPKLARNVRRELAPRMVLMVTLAWYAAQYAAEANTDPS